MLRLRTFGGCFLERDGVRLDGLSGQRKGLALLTLVASAGARGVSRDALLAYLWPESDDERARTALRQLVHALRAQLESPELLLSSSELRLNPLVIGSDVGELRDALSRGDDAAAVALYAGPFLDGFYLKGADEFERWAAGERDQLARAAAGALERLAEQAMAHGDARAAVTLWRRHVDIDPLSARATVGLMRALDAAGERAAALKHARLHETIVREEVGGAPDATVADLATWLRRADISDAPPRASSVDDTPSSSRGLRDDGTVPAPEPMSPRHAGEVPAAPSRRGRPWHARRAMLIGAVASLLLAGFATWTVRQRATPRNSIEVAPLAARAAVGHRASVAVLPFVNTSGDAANEPLSDGLTDELIAALSKVPGLRVIGRTSSFALKGKGLEARTVGVTLGVTAVVEASVRRAGDRIKVAVQLVSTDDGSVLWAESYDRTLSDVLTAQEQIARAVVAALRVRIDSRGVRPLVARSTSDPTAYELYLRGRHIFYTRPDRDGALQAARYFEQAVERDSLYARAHAGLSDVHARLAVFGFGAPGAEFALAKTAARRALSLDSTLAEAHTALGHALCVADVDMRGAENAFRRATAFDPSYTFARLPFAICLMADRRFGDAIAQLDSARAADPLAPAPPNVLGRVYVNAGRPDLAIGVLTEALELNPQLDLAYQQLGHAYLQQRRHGDAIAAFQRAAALSGARDSAQLAYGYAVVGRRGEARQIVQALVESSARRYVPAYHVALAYAALGDAEQAFAWLERARTERASMVLLKVEPGFRVLHADPRWGRLLDRVGLN